MHDTTIIERNLSTKKRRTFNFVPYCGILIVLALLVAMLVVLGTADRARRVDAVKSKYSAILAEPVPVMPTQKPPVLVKPKSTVPVKSQRVTFRVGGWDVFRFTYEEADGVRGNGHE